MIKKVDHEVIVQPGEIRVIKEKTVEAPPAPFLPPARTAIPPEK